MQPSTRYAAQLHLALVAACLVLAAYLPVWHKLWFVAESGHFGGSNTITLLLLLGLFRRWRPALGLLSALLGLQLLVGSYILACNIAAGGPTLGFLLIIGLSLVAGCILYFSPDLKQYLSQRPAAERL